MNYKFFTATVLLATAISLAPGVGGGRVELIANGSFTQRDLIGWMDESKGDGIHNGLLSIKNDSFQTSALGLNSMGGANYSLEFAKYLPIDSPADLDLLFSFKWSQLSIESGKAAAGVFLLFNSSATGDYYQRQGNADTTVGGLLYLRQRKDLLDCADLFSFLDDSRRRCVIESGISFPWKEENVEVMSLLDTHLPGVPRDQVRSVKVLVFSENRGGSGVDALFDDLCLSREGVSQALLQNGFFNNESLAGWVDESSGSGLYSAAIEFINDPPQRSALKLDSTEASNYSIEYAQYVPVKSSADLEASFSFKWKQKTIEGKYGSAQVAILFNKSSATSKYRKLGRRNTTLGGVVYVHMGGNRDGCDDAFDFLGDTQIQCHQEEGFNFAWEEITIDLKKILDQELTDVDPDDIKSIKIMISSTNEIGAGAKAYFDDFRLEKTTSTTP